MWWKERRKDLMCIAEEGGSILVYDGETLNDILFDLLSLDNVDGVLFDVGLSALPALLQGLGRLGSGFLCRSLEAADLVLRTAGPLQGRSVFLPGDTASFAGRGGFSCGMMPAVSLDAPEPANVEALQGSEVLVVLTGPLSFPTDPVAASRLRDLDRVHACIRGVYLPWGYRHGFGAAKNTLEAWQGIVGEDAVVVPGEGMGMVLESESGIPDFLGTWENLEMLKEIFPNGTIRVEPGWALFRSSTALLIPDQGEARIVPGPRLGEWAPAGQEELESGPREEYLHARRICQVPL